VTGPAGGPGAVVAGMASVRDLLPTRATFRGMTRHPRRDLVAGVTVAVVALPLALAFGISSGLGAEAGLVTAIVAGLLAALLGGSNLQVSGPTGAMTVVLIPIFAREGAAGVLVVGLMAGAILLLLAFARAGRLMRYVPLPVVEGFTVGIAVIIALQQVPAALGVAGAPGEGVLAAAAAAVGTWVAAPTFAAPALAVGVALTMLVVARIRPALPVSLAAVAVATGIAAVAALPVATIGAIPAGLPLPSLPALAGIDIGRLVLPAIAVAALAALESLLCASVADAMRVDERHDPDRELFGQAIANLAVPFFGGVPATAAIARTAVNVRAGARTRLAAMTHAVVLLAVVLGAAGLVGAIPLAALAGVLIATAIAMVRVSAFLPIVRATRGDAAAFAITAIATVALDLVEAVLIGLVVAGAFSLREMAKSARIDEIRPGDPDHAAEEAGLLDARIVAYRLDGPLFFGAAHTFLLELTEVSDVRVVVLRLSRIESLDATGASVLGETIAGLERRGTTVLLSGIRPDHAAIFRRLGVYARLAAEHHVFATTPEAIAYARVLVAQPGVPTRTATPGAAPG